MIKHHMGPGMDIILIAKKLKKSSKYYNSIKRHVQVLAYMVGKRENDDTFYFVSFRNIANELKHTESAIRCSVRYLARKGLTEYQKGLFTSNGEVFGSGYAATTMGSAVDRLLKDET